MDKKFTDRAIRVMQLANRHALELGHDYLVGGHILFGIVTEGSCSAGEILAEHIRKRSSSADGMAARTIKRHINPGQSNWQRRMINSSLICWTVS